MPRNLRAEEFTPDKAPQVAGFSCGEEPWERAISEWITGEGVFRSIVEKGSRVWLYFTQDTGELVGYGSLGKTRRRWPSPGGDYLNLSIIPAMGIQTAYQGEPRNDPPKFSHQVLGDLIHRARHDGTTLLILYVHKDNGKARGLYERFGFEVMSLEREDGYITMSHRLP